ncbi:MAG: hypothetical protein HOP15_02915, partial [Planctomycetes bacterium]|nr:hypothetical protein [Planctomycetota bacterium]
MRTLAALSFSLLVLTVPLRAQCELQELKGLNTQPLDFFGKSCAIDGPALIVGAFAASTGRPGAAHVFERRNGRWEQSARLLASDGAGGDEFGNSVGVSGDFAVVGSEYNNGVVGSNAGAA